MSFKGFLLCSTIILICGQTAYASDCQPNGLGGSFCINDDGTTSDSIPNEVDGQETYSDNGTMSSTSPTEDGNDQMISGSDPSASSGTMSNTLNSKVSRSDDPLIGKDWNAPSNLNSDGAATSSMSILSH
ncbi:RND transporter [Raoultella planticola]|uniref:RND transporter n=1 Tax=Raoultella planticola TaxID=575 RepID=UPI00178087A1|nr:RND transporter [Raoultella planticola]MBE0092281.1 RND transporter [Raoultella planticola]